MIGQKETEGMQETFCVIVCVCERGADIDFAQSGAAFYVSPLYLFTSYSPVLDKKGLQNAHFSTVMLQDTRCQLNINLVKL